MSRKVYVSVVAEIDKDGNKRPLSIRWEDGRVYEMPAYLLFSSFREFPDQSVSGDVFNIFREIGTDDPAEKSGIVFRNIPQGAAGVFAEVDYYFVIPPLEAALTIHRIRIALRYWLQRRFYTRNYVFKACLGILTKDME